ncbi:unnamed protein product [Closterium sp. Yama58-4]|nr:unnamed protein product [Closterium sp. Yama58-4]
MAAVAVAAATTSVALKLSASRNGVVSSRTPALASFSGISRTSVAGKRKIAVRATSPQVEEYKEKASELVDVAKSKWETVENKPLVALYAGGAVVGLWITSAILGAIDSIPLVPAFLKLVGTVYTGWFTYRYLIFEASRKELSDKVADLISQIK